MKSTILPYLVQSPHLIMQCRWIVFLVHCIHKEYTRTKEPDLMNNLTSKHWRDAGFEW
jgi:hypothetical protein